MDLPEKRQTRNDIKELARVAIDILDDDCSEEGQTIDVRRTSRMTRLRLEWEELTSHNEKCGSSGPIWKDFLQEGMVSHGWVRGSNGRWKKPTREEVARKRGKPLKASSSKVKTIKRSEAHCFVILTNSNPSGV